MAYRWRALMIVGLASLMALSARHLRIDDPLIYARYIRNALEGHGLVFNAGERVNALTSPLHTYLLLIASWLLRGRVLLAEWLLGVAMLLATALLAEYFIEWAGIFIAACLYFDILLGMETALFCFMLLLCVLLYVREKWEWLPVVLCLTALTRFEGGAMALVIAWQMVRQRRWPRWQSFIPALAILGLYFSLNHHFYGRWLPSSGTAKILQGISGYWGRWPTAYLRLPPVFWRPLASLFYLVPLVLWMAWRGSRTPQLRKWNPVVVPFCVILFAFYVLANVPAYLWYHAPFVLFALIYSARGLPRTRLAYAALAVAMTHEVLLGAVALRAASGLYQHYRQIGEWINANTPPGATIATTETGTLGWYCDRPIIDIVGLTTPHNAILLAHHDIYSWLEEDKPDYVLVHDQTWNTGEIAPVESSRYQRLPGDWNGVYLMRRKNAAAD